MRDEGGACRQGAGLGRETQLDCAGNGRAPEAPPSTTPAGQSHLRDPEGLPDLQPPSFDPTAWAATGLRGPG